jgi:hypothetical protein
LGERGGPHRKYRFYREWLYQQRNPRGLMPSDDWFRANPDAEFRLVARSGSGGKFWNLRFIPRRGRPCELLAEQMRIILAERFPNGTPRERLLQVFDWLKAGGVFAGRRV